MAIYATHKDIPFQVGDTVRVHYRIIEREKKAGKTKKSVLEEVKERIQPYEGTVVSIKGSQENKSFTVRRIGVNQIAIERVFPLISPWIEKIEVSRQGKVRRAKLTYLRKQVNIYVKKRITEAEKKKTAVKKDVPTKRPAKKAVAPRKAGGAKSKRAS